MRHTAKISAYLQSMFPLRSFGATLCFFVLSTLVVRSDTITLQPVAIGYQQAFGSFIQNDLVIGGNGFSDHSVLEFALPASIPPGTELVNATLTLTPHVGVTYANTSAHFSWFISGYAGDGIAQISDLALGSPLTPNMTAGPDDLDFPHQFDVTSFVSGLTISNQPYAGFGLHTVFADGLEIYFGRTDNPVTNESAPLLLLSFEPVPEPSALMFLLVGMLTLFGTKFVVPVCLHRS